MRWVCWFALQAGCHQDFGADPTSIPNTNGKQSMSDAPSAYPADYEGPRTAAFEAFSEQAPHVSARMQAGKGGTLRLFIEARQVGYFSPTVAKRKGAMGVRFLRGGRTLNSFPVSKVGAITEKLTQLQASAEQGVDFVVYKGPAATGPTDKRFLTIMSPELALRLLPHLPLSL